MRSPAVAFRLDMVTSSVLLDSVRAFIASSAIADSRVRAAARACGLAPPCITQTRPPGIGARPQRWPHLLDATHCLHPSRPQGAADTRETSRQSVRIRQFLGLIGGPKCQTAIAVYLRRSSRATRSPGVSRVRSFPLGYSPLPL